MLAEGQGGLLDVALDPAFASNRRIYLSYAERDPANPALNGTAVARAELDVATLSLSSVTVIYRQRPKVASSAHFGSRLVFDRTGALFVTMGERLLSSERGFAQDLTRGHGKIVRITTDGAPAPGNPVWTVAGAQPEIFSFGHRNPQGAALHPDTGELWSSEHGAQGGDEVNRVLAGRNYGWPLASFSQEYGTTTPVGPTTLPGTEPPAVGVGDDHRRAVRRQRLQVFHRAGGDRVLHGHRRAAVARQPVRDGAGRAWRCGGSRSAGTQ